MNSGLVGGGRTPLIPPVEKTLQVAFEKHDVKSMPHELRVSFKTYFLFYFL